MLIKALMAYQTEGGTPVFLAYLLFVMEGTIEQRFNNVEKTLATLTSTVSQLVPKKKDWRLAVGRLRDTPFNREVDRLGREYRQQQNKIP
jgi:hypothetical protein